MSIWFNPSLQISDIAKLGKGTMGDHLGMEFMAIGDDYLQMRMPVDHRTIQPFGLLHGGASCALAETAGSVAAQLTVDPVKFSCVGLEINANHIRSARQGFVIATATPLHLGATTHVWDIKIKDERDKLICICRLTMAVLKKAF